VNPKTAEELPSTVTFIGLKEGSKAEVGVEFAEPSPLFWRIAFPPPDWDSAERSAQPAATSYQAPEVNLARARSVAHRMQNKHL